MKSLTIMFVMLLAVSVQAQPYEPVAIWQREGAGDSSIYGEQILALGDQNDDSLGDWAVYAHGWGPPGQINEPKIEFFHGGNPPSTEPYMVRLTQTPEEEYVLGAVGLGDLNGDGYSDWSVIVELTNDPQNRSTYKIYFGGPGAHEVPDIVLTVPIFSGFYTIGDFNGDGYDDLFQVDGTNERGSIYYGGSPMDTFPDWQKGEDLYPLHAADLNNDGFSDVGCYSNLSGHVDFFFGNSQPDTIPEYEMGGLGLDFIRDVNGDSFDDLCYPQGGWGSISWGGEALHIYEDIHLDFPCSGSGPLTIASAGDFNGDGFGDVVMLNEWCQNSYWGVLTLHLGASWINPVPAFVIYGWTEPLNLIHIKQAVNLGDVNGDGWDDLGIGANGTPEHAAYRGKAVVVRGDTSLHVAAHDPHIPLPEALEVVAYPNPFNSATSIQITLPPFRDQVDLAVFNLLGQEVQSATLNRVVGQTSYALDASDFSTGLYFLHVSSGELQTTTKLMVLK